ncbi:helix-turn-helix domain-containing protein [Pseudohongiella spirulinae]|uniref:Putative transcriptional regulator, XRE family n=1 Tax=Pseudohongiella spirulinae TaxID=1249552 RepID=A0A0S2KE50_9GAMM|nr:helix-turn-helix transcriptional regulator [Pseudohongiella spirulinae]ALO46598.1 Putative transcriptional regulator, XRE family [Pseudohongiella spirulinae]
MANSDKYTDLLSKFQDKEYRDAYVNAEIVNGLSYQIQAMRLDRGWTQEELAELLGTRQSVISRLENPNNEAFSIKMLEALASIFDTGLMIRFVPFTKLVAETAKVRDSDLRPDSFEKEQSYIRAVTQEISAARRGGNVFNTMPLLVEDFSSGELDVSSMFKVSDTDPKRSRTEYSEVSVKPKRHVYYVTGA